MSKRILVIEDDFDAANVLEAYLKRDGFDVAIAGDGQQGLLLYRQWKPQLILLDIMLPLLSGTELLMQIRRESNIPIIMVSAMGDDPDKIGALRYGADDYVVKPYHPGEVVARVQAVLRRTQHHTSSQDHLTYHNLHVDLVAMHAWVATADDTQDVLDLTHTEFKLLALMLKYPTKAFSRLQLIEACLPESDALERVIDTHVYNLRKKLEKTGISNVLQTVRSVGYRFCS
ncbi:response regulator [Vibrio rhizosphaerae]|uniref:Response regulator n=1 Tax=Vibrio rhizosphaerae TaxID=398736 RepID=A0ABU4IWU8_9VIBR|nr:response regulator [Vibrio rhizosphaerae]MDW6093886.1 response regulator [Vibrio rhizosphaerae]